MLSDFERKLCISFGISEADFAAHRSKLNGPARAPAGALITPAQMAQQMNLDPIAFGIAHQRRLSRNASTSDIDLLRAPGRTSRELERMRELGQISDSGPEAHAVMALKELKTFLADPEGDDAIETLSRASVFVMLALNAVTSPLRDNPSSSQAR